MVSFKEASIFLLMKMHRELPAWILIFILSLTGFFLLLEFSPIPPVGERAEPAYLFMAGPAFFASVTLSSLFLMVRFFASYQKPPIATRFRHVAVASLLALAAITTWEITQMFMIERPFVIQIFLGALAGGFMMILLWLFVRVRFLRKTKDPYSS